MHRAAAAPGKLFLCGEYAVLEGAPALVAAVRPLAVARWVADAKPRDATHLPSRVANHVSARLGLPLPPGAPVVDTSEFVHEDGAKRGLGSSAAAAAAAAGVASLALGAPPEAPEIRPFLLAAASAAHSEHQGGVGSGADVAAAIHGGVIGFSMGAGPQTLEVPPGLRWAAVRVGPGGACTPDMLRALRQLDPVSSRQVMAELADAAGEAVRAWVDGRVRRFLQWIEAYRDGMARLGGLIERPIVTPADLAVAEIARRHGGAAKPSGAGGGELAVVFAPGTDALDRILADCDAGGAPAAVGVAPAIHGVHALEPSGPA